MEHWYTLTDAKTQGGAFTTAQIIDGLQGGTLKPTAKLNKAGSQK